MKRIAILIGFLFAGTLHAQSYGRLDFSLQTAQGQAIAGATVNVYTQSACGQPAGALAQAYSSSTGGAISQPITTDGFGHADAYFSPGCVTVIYYSNYTGTLTYADQNVLLAGVPAACTIVPIPVSCGGTNATTTAAALANLGAQGPVYNILSYGAVGNCTGSGATTSCTDNTTAIQNAINAAYTSGGAVYFPSSPSATGQTVYYVASTINPKGVSMYGPPGSSGASNYWANNAPVAIRGAPGKDVFDVVAQGATGYVLPHPSYTVKDLAILIDGSVDASASFTGRRPGRTCNDVVANGTAVITSAAQCVFQPGDVGQAITVGGTTTTIASWQSATQVTLATSITAGGSLGSYISVFGLAVTQNIGNCAFAYDDPGGTFTGTGPIKVLFSNVVIQYSVSGTGNHTCGYFFQGNQAPYQTRWEHGFVASDFPFAFVPVSTTSPSTSLWTGLGDFNVWDHMWIGGNYSFLSYDGFDNRLQDVQISGANNGPHILSAYGLETPNRYATPNDWSIDVPEIEVPNSAGCTSSDVAFRISGGSHVVNRLGSQYCTSNVLTFKWDASNSTVKNWGFTSIGTVNISGSNNDFAMPFNNASYGAATVNVTGQGNLLTTERNSNPLNGIQPARRQYAGNNATAVGTPLLSRGAVAFNRTHDFIDKGAAAYYLNGEDLWLWPYEVGSSSTGPGVVTDATSDTGSALFQAGGTGQFNLSESNGTSWTIGSQFPAGKMRIYVKAKSSVASTWETFWAQANEGGTWTQIGSANFQLTTSYAVYSFDVDTTGLTGDAINIIYGGYGMPANNVYIAWIGVRPWASDMPVGSLQIGSGTPMTGNNGTGVYVQHSDGTGTVGHFAVYASDGSTTNGPAQSTYGYATLASGTVTVSNSAACTPSATCVYKLANCGVNGSTAIGTLSIGTVSAGTSFVINSESATATVVTGDTSNVCWQIN